MGAVPVENERVLALFGLVTLRRMDDPEGMIFSRSFRSLTAVIVALAGVGIAAFFWDSFRSVEALFRESEELQNALARLRQEEVVAYLWLLDQPAPDQLEIAWLELPATGGPPAQFRTLRLEGKEAFLDALVIKMPGQLVADGDARALIFWRRAFGSAEAPEAGPMLDRIGSVPARYEGWLGNTLDARDTERFWEVLWNLAHEPDRLTNLGIEAVYGNAVSVAPRRGFFYTVRLSGTGGVSLHTAPMTEAPSFLPLEPTASVP